jgi:hypothetical protein
MLTQRCSRALKHIQVHSIAFNWIQYLLTGIHVHSHTFKCVQLCSILTKRSSHALRSHSSAFNCIHTHSKALMHIQFHVGISKKWIQSHSDSLKDVHMHSSVFKHIQCSLKGIHAHSEHVQSCSVTFNQVQSHSLLTQKAFTHTQVHSVVVTLTQRHSTRPDN